MRSKKREIEVTSSESSEITPQPIMQKPKSLFAVENDPQVVEDVSEDADTLAAAEPKFGTRTNFQTYYGTYAPSGALR